MTEQKQGFRVPRRTAVLDFEGSDFKGAEARCLFDVPLETVFAFQRLMGREDADAQEEALRNFGDGILTDWNLEDDDGPLPATGDGMMQLSASFAMTMVRAWLEAMQSPAPLSGAPSRNGSTSEAASPKKDKRSRSRRNS